VTLQSKPLVQKRNITTHHVVKKTRGAKSKWFRKVAPEGKRYAKAISLDKLGARG